MSTASRVDRFNAAIPLWAWAFVVLLLALHFVRLLLDGPGSSLFSWFWTLLSFLALGLMLVALSREVRRRRVLPD